MVTDREEFIRQVKTGGSLGCNDHALDEFLVLRNMGLAKSKVRTVSFSRVNSKFFKELVDEIHGETDLRYRGADQSWQLS